MKSVLWTVAVAIALGASGNALLAQPFPSKMVRLVIPFPVGGSTDANTRIIGPHLSERWKQQVVLDPRPGAATVIGSDYVAKSAPDGHTLLFNSSTYTTGPALFAKLPYDPLTDLIPVTLVTISPNVIVAHPSLPAKNIRELVALAKARPGALNLGNAGSSLSTHFFNMLANVKIEPVPYKGVSPLVIDAMGGHVPLATGAVSSFQAAIREGRLRLLGVTSHSSVFPDAGIIGKDVPGFDSDSWFGLFAPRGTSRELVGRIRDDVAAVLQIRDVRQRLLDIGAEPGGSTPDEFATRVRNDIAKWLKVAKAVGLQPQ